MKLENLKGKVIKKFDLYTKGDFKKLEIVIETGTSEHPNPLKVAAMNDRVDFLEKLSVGDEVEFSAFVAGNDWNDKYFVNLNLAFIKKTEGAASGATVGSDLPF